ncbi:hemin-degrading factor [Crenobacter cavernae]|uniref:Hemin-degrading factor n=1 Tax=Crenobacter cavernae TaxID=2290923 RepID=A0ABY0F9E7_9NEIS|nr:ChuX/HutX family heme-like substrate-binding protein [Crenobacter cavernae]RXZ42093.1 hemin-degrading factor [Crenobacter cavernae]
MNLETPLYDRYQALLAAEPKTRQRDAADKLGVSEAEIVSVLPHAKRLRLDDIAGLLGRFESLGRVMALSRNAWAVHEKKGRYHKLQLSGKMGLALDPDGIDLRFFFTHWAYAFALESEQGEGKRRRAIEIYDTHGEAIQKVVMQEADHDDAWQALVAGFATEATPLADPPAADPLTPEDATEPFDAAGYEAAWLALRDVHHFHALTRRFGLSRRDAFARAPAGFTRQVSANAAEILLRAAAGTGLPIMVFVGNRGIVQIHTGPVTKIERMGPWINVLDADFNLHLFDAEVAEAWYVRRPISDGVVTAVELFDGKGGTIATFFGKRHEGQPEDPQWAALAESLPDAGGVADVA